MAQITKKLTQAIYTGPGTFALSGLPTAAKSAIKLIRQVNAAGTGYASFNPATTINSLTQVVAGDARAQVIIEALAASPNFALDNFSLVPVGGGAPAPSVLSLSGPAGETVTASADVITPSDAFTISAAFTTGAGTLEYALASAPDTWAAAAGVSLAAETSFLLRVQHPNNAAFAVTVTLTY